MEADRPRCTAHSAPGPLAKLAGANLLIVAAALAAVVIERQRTQSANAVSILGIALGVSLVVNLVLVYVALRPLSDLEATRDASRPATWKRACRRARWPIATSHASAQRSTRSSTGSPRIARGSGGSRRR